MGLVNVGASHLMVSVPAYTVARYGGPEEYGRRKGYGKFEREHTLPELLGVTGGSIESGKGGPTWRNIQGEN